MNYIITELKVCAGGIRKSNDHAAKKNNPVIKKKGETVELHQNPNPATAKFLAKFIPAIANNLKNYKMVFNDYQ